MYCINCAKEINDNSNYCIYCGELVSDDKTLLRINRPNTQQTILGVAGAMLLMILAFAGAIYLVANDYNNETLIATVIIGLLLVSILPSVLFFITGKKEYGKGFMFGTIGFYLLLILIVLFLFR